MRIEGLKMSVSLLVKEEKHFHLAAFFSKFLETYTKSIFFDFINNKTMRKCISSEKRTHESNVLGV